MNRGARASFVVRVVQNRRGKVNGVIERVATGAKEAFTDMDAIGRLILKMLGRDEAPPQPAHPKPGSARRRRGGSTRKEGTD
jgi:hypothetical protein